MSRKRKLKLWGKINPDYGYDVERVEYERSAIGDTNAYYDDGDDDEDYQNTSDSNVGPDSKSIMCVE